MYRLSIVLVLASCAGVPSARDHLDAGEKALRAGNFGDARSHFNSADLVSRERWVHDATRNGYARVRVEEVRRELPVLEALPPTRDNMREVLARIRLVRDNGGDDALEAKLRAIIDDALIAWAQKASADGQYAADGLTALDLKDYALGSVARDAIDRVLQRASEEHAARATAVGARKLAAQAHRALAELYAGKKPSSDPELVAEFAYGLDVTVTGVSCPQLASVLNTTSPTAPRRVKVSANITDCEIGSDEQTKRDKVEWQENKFIRMERGPVTEKVCGYRDVAVPAPGYDCTSYGDRVRCSSARSSISVYMCEDVTRIVERPVYETIQHSAVRETTLKTSKAYLRVELTATRGDNVETTTYIHNESSSHRSAPAVGEQSAIDEGHYFTAEQLVSRGLYDAQRKLWWVGSRAFGVDTRAAEVAARAAAGDDAEEAWARAAMTESLEVGPWTRYGLDANTLHDMIAGSYFLPEGRALDLGVRRELPAVTRPPEGDDTPGDSEIYDLETLLVPSFGRKGWFGLESNWVRVPTVMEGGLARGDQGAGMLGLRIGYRLLNRGEPWGLKLVDEMRFFGGLGARFAGTDTGGFAYQGEVGYVLGVGYRTYRRGALFVGAKAYAGRFSAGGATSNYASVPLFARLELPLGFMTLAAEASGYTLAGTPQWAGEVHVAFKKTRSIRDVQKGLVFRAARLTTDVSLGAPSDAAMAMPITSNLDVMTYSLMFVLSGD